MTQAASNYDSDDSMPMLENVFGKLSAPLEDSAASESGGQKRLWTLTKEAEARGIFLLKSAQVDSSLELKTLAILESVALHRVQCCEAGKYVEGLARKHGGIDKIYINEQEVFSRFGADLKDEKAGIIYTMVPKTDPSSTDTCNIRYNKPDHLIEFHDGTGLFADTKGKWSGFESSTSRQNLAKVHGQMNNAFTGGTKEGPPVILNAITILQASKSEFNMVIDANTRLEDVPRLYLQLCAGSREMPLNSALFATNASVNDPRQRETGGSPHSLLGLAGYADLAFDWTQDTWLEQLTTWLGSSTKRSVDVPYSPEVQSARDPPSTVDACDEPSCDKATTKADHEAEANSSALNTLQEKRRALIVLQGSAAREASKAAQDYADALLAEAARLAAAAAVADKAAQQAVRVAKHMRAAEIAAELVAKTMAAPASCQQNSDSPSGHLPLKPAAAAMAPVAAAVAPALPKQIIPNLQGPRASAIKAGTACLGGQGRQQGAASSTGGTVSPSAFQQVQTAMSGDAALQYQAAMVTYLRANGPTNIAQINMKIAPKLTAGRSYPKPGKFVTDNPEIFHYNQKTHVISLKSH